VLCAFLNIEETFENISFDAISPAATEHGLEETCCRWVRSMLESRLVHTLLMDSNLTAQVVGRCPPAGVLSPLLWNVVVDRLLCETSDPRFSTFDYANDIVIILQGQFSHTAMEHTQDTLDVVFKWTVKGLNISPYKTIIFPFPIEGQ
jgi:hypothetical protein